MKVLWIAILFGLAGCSTPKKIMKNCDYLHDDLYECEEVSGASSGGNHLA